MTAREQAQFIFNQAVAAVHPSRLLPAHLSFNKEELHICNHSFSLATLPPIYVIGAGKASAAMAASVEAILGTCLTAGLVVTKYQHSIPLKVVQLMEAAHPVPDHEGIIATAATTRLLRMVQPGDIVICLISGGASALWIDLPGDCSLDDVQQTYATLLNAGASIQEMNTVRKHLSSIKGGQLIQHAPTAHWFTLVISDVPGDQLEVIASGPTVPDPTYFSDAIKVINKYQLEEKLPKCVLRYIQQGNAGLVPETLKPGDPIFKKVNNQLIGNNDLAIQAAKAAAKQLGFIVVPGQPALTGDAATQGRWLARFIKDYTGQRPACLLLGGETTVQVTGKGKGGRNQHLTLSMMVHLTGEDLPPFCLLAAGTDGTDGPTDAAGAFVDPNTLLQASKLQLNALDYLTNCNAYSFFKLAHSIFITGPTQTNVMDLVIVLLFEGNDLTDPK